MLYQVCLKTIVLKLVLKIKSKIYYYLNNGVDIGSKTAGFSSNFTRKITKYFMLNTRQSKGFSDRTVSYKTIRAYL